MSRFDCLIVIDFTLAQVAANSYVTTMSVTFVCTTREISISALVSWDASRKQA